MDTWFVILHILHESSTSHICISLSQSISYHKNMLSNIEFFHNKRQSSQFFIVFDYVFVKNSSLQRACFLHETHLILEKPLRNSKNRSRQNEYSKIVISNRKSSGISTTNKESLRSKRAGKFSCVFFSVCLALLRVP